MKIKTAKKILSSGLPMYTKKSLICCLEFYEFNDNEMELLINKIDENNWDTSIMRLILGDYLILKTKSAEDILILIDKLIDHKFNEIVFTTIINENLLRNLNVKEHVLVINTIMEEVNNILKVKNGKEILVNVFNDENFYKLYKVADIILLLKNYNDIMATLINKRLLSFKDLDSIVKTIEKYENKGVNVNELIEIATKDSLINKLSCEYLIKHIELYGKYNSSSVKDIILLVNHRYEEKEQLIKALYDCNNDPVAFYIIIGYYSIEDKLKLLNVFKNSNMCPEVGKVILSNDSYGYDNITDRIEIIESLMKCKNKKIASEIAINNTINLYRGADDIIKLMQTIDECVNPNLALIIASDEDNQLLPIEDLIKKMHYSLTNEISKKDKVKTENASFGVLLNKNDEKKLIDYLEYLEYIGKTNILLRSCVTEKILTKYNIII